MSGPDDDTERYALVLGPGSHFSVSNEEGRETLIISNEGVNTWRVTLADYKMLTGQLPWNRDLEIPAGISLHGGMLGPTRRRRRWRRHDE